VGTIGHTIRDSRDDGLTAVSRRGNKRGRRGGVTPRSYASGIVGPCRITWRSRAAAWSTWRAIRRRASRTRVSSNGGARPAGPGGTTSVHAYFSGRCCRSRRV